MKMVYTKSLRLTKTVDESGRFGHESEKSLRKGAIA
jgi:hypothetical protein